MQSVLKIAAAALATFLLLCSIAFSAPTVSISNKLTRDYARVSFSWSEKVRFKVSNAGKTLLLTFEQPLTAGVGSIPSQLTGYVTGASLSPDKKILTLTLSQPYKTRTFISNNVMGVDILSGGKAPAKAAPKETPTAEKPITPPQETKPAEVVKSAPVPEVTQTEVKATAPSSKATPPQILSLNKKEPPKKESKPAPKKPEPKKEIKKPEPKKEAKKNEEPKKKPEPAKEVKKEAKKETKPEPAKEAKKEEKQEAKKEEKKPEQPAKEAATPAPAAAQQTAAPTPATNAAGEMLVSVAPTKNGFEMHFPWKERTAVAAFMRAGTLWVVFNKPARLNMDALSSAPPGITQGVEQEIKDKYTVLRIATKGEVYARTGRRQGDEFGWTIELSKRLRVAKALVNIELKTEPPLKPHVFMPVLELDEPVTLSDPLVGDELIIVPFYKEGQAIFPERKFIEATLLATAQGLAIQKVADDTRVTLLRNGLKIARPMGMQISSNLPTLSLEEYGLSESGVSTLFPYDRWKLSDPASFAQETDRLQGMIIRNTGEKASAARLKLVQLYLAQGFHVEALAVLQFIKSSDLEFYNERKLAALAGAANFMMYRIAEAAVDFDAAELNDQEEIKLWRGAVSELLGDGKARLDYLKYEKDYISRYPPQFRERLAIIAADRAIAKRDFNTAFKIFESLDKDKLIGSIQNYVDFMIGTISAETGQKQAAINIWKTLAENYADRFIRARAEFSMVVMQLQDGSLSREDAIKKLDHLRIVWRGDALELNLLRLLGSLYIDQKDYINALRTWREIVTNFPNTPEANGTAQKMADLFVYLFNQKGADNMTPLGALSLYYEFRELTPLGEEGDKMIRNLADRLAAVDLLDRAGALLAHQVQFRLDKEERSRVGARLALIYLLNREPQKALDTLALTGYGENPEALQRSRTHLASTALKDLKQYDKALGVLDSDYTVEAEQLKLDIFWAKRDWPNVITIAEELLSQRKNITAQLTEQESGYLLKLALAYAFERDSVQLQYLRDYFGPLMKDNPNHDVFMFIVDDSGPIDPKNFERVATDINRIETFMGEYKKQVREGDLSQTMNEQGAPATIAPAPAAAPAIPQPATDVPTAPEAAAAPEAAPAPENTQAPAAPANAEPAPAN